MVTLDIKEEVVRLRAMDYSLDKIASTLNISKPKVIDITNESASDNTGIMVGAKYDETNKSFINPAYTAPTPEQIAEAQKIMDQAKQAGLA